MKSICVFAAVLAVLLSLSACGKTSRPEPVPGSGYPHIYPRR